MGGQSVTRVILLAIAAFSLISAPPLTPPKSIWLPFNLLYSRLHKSDLSAFASASVESDRIENAVFI
jgi:hypothetical protein